MADTWDGRPENPERDDLHYITDGVALWLAGPQKWALLNRTRRERPEWLAAQPWAEYRGRCPTPAEVEARVAAARREGIGAALDACLRREHFHIVDDYDDENDDLRADGVRGCIAAIRALLEDER